jgi:hypothetical protein
VESLAQWFMGGEQTLSVHQFDQLCDSLDLRLVARKKW